MQRKEHKERAQPIKRKRFGLLEKHKDYVKRAKDYHSKQDRLQKMRKKAAVKNPDEFYFGMKNAKTKKGVHKVEKHRPEAMMSADMQKLVSTQDLTYAHMTLAQEKKKIDNLQDNLHFLTDRPLSKHTVFVDSTEEVAEFDAAEYFDTPEELADRAYNRLRKKDLEEGAVADGSELGKGVKKKLRKQKEKKYVELYVELWLRGWWSEDQCMFAHLQVCS